MDILSVLKDFSEVIASVILGFSGYVLTNRHHKQNIKLTNKQHKFDLELQKDQFEKELFEKFNSKYDKLNEVLNDLVSQGHIIEGYETNTIKEKFTLQYNTLMDYFNLCSEQYFWYKKGRVSKDLWKAWYTGMNYYYNNSKVLRDLWEEEVKGDGYISYYLEEGDNLFKEKVAESTKN